jgi:hypothetical protein
MFRHDIANIGVGTDLLTERSGSLIPGRQLRAIGWLASEQRFQRDA